MKTKYCYTKKHFSDMTNTEIERAVSNGLIPTGIRYFESKADFDQFIQDGLENGVPFVVFGRESENPKDRRSFEIRPTTVDYEDLDFQINLKDAEYQDNKDNVSQFFQKRTELSEFIKNRTIMSDLAKEGVWVTGLQAKHYRKSWGSLNIETLPLILDPGLEQRSQFIREGLAEIEKDYEELETAETAETVETSNAPNQFLYLYEDEVYRLVEPENSDDYSLIILQNTETGKLRIEPECFLKDLVCLDLDVLAKIQKALVE